MARIPKEELERLKRDVSVVQLAEARGVSLKRHGSDLIGLCPYHEDHEPSLVITPSKNLWHCLGACQAGGSVIDWVMRSEGVGFRNAVERLREQSAISHQRSAFINTSADNGQEINSFNRESPFDAKASDLELMIQVVDYYHETLKQSEEALEYLERRGLNNSEMIERFKLGYANRTLGYRLPEKNRVAGAEIRTRLQNLGILRESGHEHFNGSLIIPVFDESGTVTEIYGRKIHDNLRTGTPKHLYLPGPHHGVWNIAAVQASKEIILGEALIDALTFWSAGYQNVTSSYGIEGFTVDHLAAFKRYGIEKILIAYDRDEAGEIAARILSEKLTREGITCYRIHFPKGMDANEYALKVKPAEKSLGLMISSAVWMVGKELSVVSSQLSEDREAVAAFGLMPTTLDEISQSKEEGHFPLAALPSLECVTSIEIGAINKAAAVEPVSAERCLETTAQRGPGPPPSGLSRRGDVCKLDEDYPIAASTQNIPTEIKGDDIIITIGDRTYRIRGLSKNLSTGHMKVNVKAARGEEFHMDTLDLCADNPRRMFIKVTAVELAVEEETIKRDLKKVLNKLEELQDDQIQNAVAPKEMKPEMTSEEEVQALEFLKRPDLLDQIQQHFRQIGIVGEENNVITSYLAAISRKLEKPLAILIQSSSAAGKSSLMDAVLSFMPEEDQVKYSAMTGQSLFYMEGANLKNKILAIAEEEGAQRASYALKLLQSEGELKIASTGKDPTTGRLTTHEYKVEGPVMIFSTTTAIEIDEELLNRCVVLSVNEDREQTRAIHRMQREMQTIKGLWAKEERKRIRKLHQNAQRMLKPLNVVNPYANELTFLDDKTRTRRDHEKYLSLILSVTMLHQYQRAIKTAAIYGVPMQYIETTLEDIEITNKLANEILGRTLDELPPQTRRFLMLLDQMVKEVCERMKMEQSEYRFMRRDIREYTGWSYDQVRVHVDRLVEMEYLLVHRGGRGQNFVYELLYDGKGRIGEPFLIGLIDVESLRARKSKSTIRSLGCFETSLGYAAG